MYDGAEGGQFELKVVLAVVVLLGLIRIGGALTEGGGERPGPEPVAASDPRGAPPSAEARPPAVDLPSAEAPDSTQNHEAAPPDPASDQAATDAAGRDTADVAAPPRPSHLPAPQPPPDALDPEVFDDEAIAAQLGSRVRLEEQIVAPPPVPPPDSALARPEGTPEPPPPREPEFFEAVEQMPELVGGLAALQRRIVYPEHAYNAGVEGRVFVQFVVDERGAPYDVRVVRGIGAGCDEAAIEAIRASRFVPGRQRGRPVKVQMTLPVTFRLDD